MANANKVFLFTIVSPEVHLEAVVEEGGDEAGVAPGGGPVQRRVAAVVLLLVAGVRPRHHRAHAGEQVTRPRGRDQLPVEGEGGVLGNHRQGLLC